MFTIMGIIASPRRMGNSEIMVKEIGRNVRQSHQLRLIRLPDFDIKSCRGCYTCLMEAQRCPLDDDLYTLLEAIAAADALIVAAPTYFLGPNACLKKFLDRGLAFYAYGDSLWGKPAVGVGIAGIEGKEGYTQLGIESFLKLMLADLRQCEMIYGALPGEIFLSSGNRAMARRLAESLVAEAPANPAPQCPVCGGQTFRFLGADNVRCMLCSNAGTIRLQEGNMQFRIAPSAHELFLNREAARVHQQWLLDMKQRFLDTRQQLKQITRPYLKDGCWIQPVKANKD